MVRREGGGASAKVSHVYSFPLFHFMRNALLQLQGRFGEGPQLVFMVGLRQLVHHCWLGGWGTSLEMGLGMRRPKLGVWYCAARCVP